MLSPCLLELLRAYYRILRPAGEWLFPSLAPAPASDRRRRAVRQSRRSATERPGQTRHPPHAAAQLCHSRRVDSRVIQALLGHSSIETTARYPAVSPATVSATASPLDQLLQPAKGSPPRVSVLKKADAQAN